MVGVLLIQFYLLKREQPILNHKQMVVCLGHWRQEMEMRGLMWFM
jgi:hypothetical protein